MTVCTVCGTEPCYVHCVYCDEPVGCDAFTESGVPHSPVCPTVTGLYPVRDRDVQCPGGCGCRTGMRCFECETELEVGDLYAHLTIRDGEIPTVVVVCLGCAAAGIITDGVV